MGDKTRRIGVTPILLGFLLLIGLVCGIFYHCDILIISVEPCDQCYNGGNLSQETKTCTCAEGYSGQCCEINTEWSEWTPCSKVCGPGSQFRIKQNFCPSNLQNCSQTMEERVCNVHCFYGGTLSNVSNECICLSGYGGEFCECEIQDCEMTPWSEWSTCTRTCGPQGTRFRTRNVNKQPTCGGAPCSENITETENCNRECYNGILDYSSDQCICPAGYNGECCECKIQDCVMTPWSDWSACTHTCGPLGTTFRTRDVDIAPTCGGTECSKFMERNECNRECYNNGILSYRSDKCECPSGYNGECCECKIQDCVMTSWSDWSACSKTCGWDGTHFRTRDVYKAPTCGGTECHWFVDQGSCNYGVTCDSGRHPLHIPTLYLSLFFSYMYIKLQASIILIPSKEISSLEIMEFSYPESDLNFKMDYKNNSRKLRIVLIVLGLLFFLLVVVGFIVCGVYHHVYECHQWTEWMPCSKDCGAGIQYRVMLKENDYVDLEEKCSLKAIEERACNVQCYHGGMPSNYTKECICESGYGGECCECEIQDCEMTPWSQWSACTRECGPQGTRFRTRDVAKQPTCGGAPCSEKISEKENCNRECYNNGNLSSDQCFCPAGYNGECCECKIQDCVMTPWSDWSACTHTCGPLGTTFRTRDVEIAPTCGGTECSKFIDKNECNRECYNNGSLSSDQCICSVGYNGDCCECKIQGCVMAPWSDWSACTHTCGPLGTTFRTRDVDIAPTCGGTECSKFIERNECNRECYNNGILGHRSDKCECPSGYNGECCECKIQDCVMAPWSDWSACTHTCGPLGTTFRTRDVDIAPTCGGTECSKFIERNECNRECYNNGILSYRSDKCECPSGYNGECCECKIQDCVMTSWSDWSACSKTCGWDGTHFRTRDVYKAPTCGGTECYWFVDQGSCNYGVTCDSGRHLLHIPTLYLSLCFSYMYIKLQ
ncbi:protein eyes shut homolog [Anneissia japonica]|uniref:protein eyes shut homolog n=1 Tax=Anneissia japonica TaxID=1529436 RepID=UPI001425851B|nr:protein eyes shut homolog [Anneissia japonica]